MKLPLFRAVLSPLLGVCFSTTAVWAQAQPKPDGLWHGSVAAGLAAVSGNTRTTSLSLSADVAKETAQDKWTLYASGLNAESKTGNTTTRTADFFRGGVRYDRNLSDRLFGYGSLDAETNRLQNLDLRAAAATGLGYKVIRTDRTTFNVFAGVGYIANNFKAPLQDTDGFTLQLGEESTHKLSATADFKQRLVVFPGLESNLGTRATWDATVSAALAGNLSLNLTYSARTFSKAPAGVKSVDSALIVGVGYKF
jgi:putative salt-induced outer membrane protein